MQGIMFSEAMFHATIEGRKTQTRRIVPYRCNDGTQDSEYITINKVGSVYYRGMNIQSRFKLGETVFIQEPYYITHYQGGLLDLEWKECVKYKYGTKYENYEWAWKNKLYMPAKYARHFIKITGVRCERVQDISDEDCLKEGMISELDGSEVGNMVYWFKGTNDYYHYNPKKAYANLFDSIHGKGTWDSNPYVWIYDYKLIK